GADPVLRRGADALLLAPPPRSPAHLVRLPRGNVRAHICGQSQRRTTENPTRPGTGRTASIFFVHRCLPRASLRLAVTRSVRRFTPTERDHPTNEVRHSCVGVQARVQSRVPGGAALAVE